MPMTFLSFSGYQPEVLSSQLVGGPEGHPMRVTRPLPIREKPRGCRQNSRPAVVGSAVTILECPMPRVLVVDDQTDVRAMISILLRVNHFEVTEAESAAAGLRAFEDAKFDVAIVDIFLSDACGFDFIAAIRERAPRLAIVAVSGMATLD